MGMKKPIVLEIAYRTFAINEFGAATCFVLKGTERGLVIDAGTGMYNIREIVDELMEGLPYDVAITHGHCDHIAWADEWNEVYLHPADNDIFYDIERNKRMTEDYPGMMAKHGTYDAYDIPMTQITFPDHMPKVIPMEDGHVFDLGGGRKVDVIHTPGHSKGEVVFIDPSVRILFSGDACNPNLGIRATSINTALKGLLKVKAREKDFDRNFNSHIGYGGSTVHIAMPDSCLDDCLYIMTGLVKGEITPEHAVSPFRPGSAPIYFVRHGAVQISLDPNRIIDEGEEPAV